ncbi:MAG: DUF3110 domain-containing protein [Geitlerinemataceae cyanobacterium]
MESMRVFVLLFNARTENEGIHTIRLATPDGKERNIIMMFESEDDATRYAMLLEAQDFHAPTVEAIESEEIEAFCQGSGYETKLIPEGFVPQSPEERVFLSPPEANLDETDWAPEGLAAEPTAEEISNSELDDIRRRLEGLL